MKERTLYSVAFSVRSAAQACILALVAALCLSGAAMAGGATQGPHISVAEPLHDFGTVAAGTVLEHVFEIRNTGDGVLLLGKIEPS